MRLCPARPQVPSAPLLLHACGRRYASPCRLQATLIAALQPCNMAYKLDVHLQPASRLASFQPLQTLGLSSLQGRQALLLSGFQCCLALALSSLILKPPLLLRRLALVLGSLLLQLALALGATCQPLQSDCRLGRRSYIGSAAS